MNLSARLAREKVRIESVISQPQTPPIGLCADSAKRLQKFEQADILAACTIQNRERVAGDRRIDGDVLFVCRGRAAEGATDRSNKVANRMARAFFVKVVGVVVKGTSAKP